MNWDLPEYRRQRRQYIAERGLRHPMLTATALIFTATWVVGWLCSAELLRHGITSMPARYALSFLVSYGAFFVCVRVWCNSAYRNHGDGNGAGVDFGNSGVYPEGCLIVLVIAALAFMIAGLFWVTGGVGAMLEAAFEVAFAGTVVRRLGGTEIVGRWARALFLNTWPHALVALLVLAGFAAALQRAAPGSVKLSEAVKVVLAKRAAGP